ncbi:MAG TPA: GAF domain-containing protein [Candidatus Acidoferrales bacterium]|nr:GAF domain-containing protein [Candidatus Acidoferrales bacterium]
MEADRPKRTLRVLILEDSEDDALLMVRELQRAGYEVAFERVDTPQFFSAELALERWDIVLADYHLPYFSGYEALELWKKSASTAPLIFVSGVMTPEVAVGAIREGAHDYINKNHLGLLVPAIERELGAAEERRRARAALQSTGEELNAKIRKQAQELEGLNEALAAEVARHEQTRAMVRRYLECRALLRGAAERAAAGLDLPDLARSVVGIFERALPDSVGTVRLFEGGGIGESTAYASTLETKWRDPMWETAERALAGQAAGSNSPVAINKLEDEPDNPCRAFFHAEGLVSYFAAPLSARGKLLGRVSLYTRRAHDFSREEIELLAALAEQAALAIDDSQRRSQ